MVFESAAWPTLRDMPDFDGLLKGSPDAMKDLFNLDAMSTATEFLNAELFTVVLPTLFVIFAVSRGGQAVSAGPLGGGVPVSFVWPALVALVVVVGALPAFVRGDMRAV